MNIRKRGDRGLKQYSIRLSHAKRGFRGTLLTCFECESIGASTGNILQLHRVWVSCWFHEATVIQIRGIRIGRVSEGLLSDD